MQGVRHPRNITGGTVRGQDLFGRDAFLVDLQRRVEVGSLLLLAPRRWGKSSVLQTFADGDPGRRRYVDLYDANTPDEFVDKVARACEGLSDRIKDIVAWAGDQTLGRIKGFDMGGVGFQLGEVPSREPGWKARGHDLVDALSQDYVLILDEFPVLAKRLLDVDEPTGSEFLMWLRTIRQQRGAPRFIFAGSTSLSEVCARAGLSATVNDLEGIPLPAFDENDAVRLLRAVFGAEGVPGEDPLFAAMIDCVGPEVPYFLQLIAQSVIGEYWRTNTLPTAARIANLYESEVLSARTRHNLDDYWQRIDHVYTVTEAEVIRVVLSALSKRRRAALSYTTIRNRVVARGFDPMVLDRVVPLMENDFYVRRTSGNRSLAMLNRCLADWWRIYHGGD